jgi:hypothetical protein
MPTVRTRLLQHPVGAAHCSCGHVCTVPPNLGVFEMMADHQIYTACHAEPPQADAAIT